MTGVVLDAGLIGLRYKTAAEKTLIAWRYRLELISARNIAGKLVTISCMIVTICTVIPS
jgi:hypothetical protein